MGFIELPGLTSQIGDWRMCMTRVATGHAEPEDEWRTGAARVLGMERGNEAIEPFFSETAKVSLTRYLRDG